MGAWGSQWHGFAERTMAVYAHEAAQTEHVTVVSNDPRSDFLVYAFYNDLPSEEVRRAVVEQTYATEKIRFLNDCTQEVKGVFIIDAIKEQCGFERGAALVESQRRFQIYGDKLCTNAKLENYYRADWSLQNLKDFETASLSDFCEKWFFGRFKLALF